MKFAIWCAQELLLRVGVLGHLVPLLFGYDATHDSGAQPDHFDYGGTQKAQGPAFLGLGIQRSNMQVTAASSLAQTSRYAHPELFGLHMLSPLALTQECYKHLEGEGVWGEGGGGMGYGKVTQALV